MKGFWITAVAATSMLLASAASASVARGSDYTFDFSGTCTDCSGTDRAQVKLTNYFLGDAVTPSNFVSFHFDGSNLYSAFTITSPSYVGGEFTTTSASTENFTVYDMNHFFNSSTTGSWGLGTTALADYGTNGKYGVSSAVPEPAGWALLILGFGAIGAAARTRRARRAAGRLPSAA